MSQWKEVKLGNIASVQTGPFGSQLHNEDYKESGTPIVTVEHLGNKKFTRQNLPRVSQEDCVRLAKYSMKTGDIIFSRVGAVDRCSLVSQEESGWLFSSRCLCVRANDEIDSEWLYYYFCLDTTKLNVRSIAVGATMPSINTKILSNDVFVKYPTSIESQQRIASILSSLDAKIENNNKINAKLEEIAQNLFKEWFVDFSPFMNGKFVESELGLIPEGWRVGTLGEIIINTIAGDWGKDNEEGNFTFKVACIRGADIEDVKAGNKGKMPTRYILPKNFNAKHLEANDLVVEISGGSPTQSTGRICLISDSLLNRYDNALVCTNFCRALKPIPEYSMFLYNIWQNLYDKGVMFLYENGTTGIKNLALNDLIAKQLVILPPKEITLKFNNLVASFEMVIQQNGIENEKLATIRDTLLPKLMSGEIEV